MKTTNQLQPWLPEMYLIASVMLYWMLSGTLLNPIAIALILLLTTQVLRKSEIAGVMISILFLIINLYMVLALIAALKEFSTLNISAQRMLIWGSVYLGLNIIFSIVMLMKWRNKISHLPRNIKVI